MGGCIMYRGMQRLWTIIQAIMHGQDSIIHFMIYTVNCTKGWSNENAPFTDGGMWSRGRVSEKLGCCCRKVAYFGI